MKRKPNLQAVPARLPARESGLARRSLCLTTVLQRRRLGEGGFFNLRVSIGLLTVVAGLLFVLFATANPSKGGGRALGAQSNGPTRSKPLSGQVTGRTFARVTPGGIITERLLAEHRPSLARVILERPV